MVRIIEKNPLLTILLVCTGLYFFNLGILQVTIMEARNFIVAREMITEGNWFLTTMNGIARYEKPPVPAWITTPFIATGGTGNIVANRLPTSLAATLGVIIMYLFVRDMTKDRRLALMSSLILSTSFYYLAIRFEAPSDTYAFVFMFSGIYFLYKSLSSERIRYGFLVLAGCATGLSFLSKGPIGPYALLLPFLPAWFITFKRPGLKRTINYLAVFFTAALIVGGSWYIYVRWADPETFTEIAKKETGNWSSYNVKPFYYYWSFFIQTGIWAVPALLSLLYPILKSRIKHRDLYRLSWLWTLMALLLLSAVPEKKSRYLVPVLIPLAINTAIYLGYIIDNFNYFRKPQDRAGPWLLFGISAMAGLAFPLIILLISPQSRFDWAWYLISCLLFTGTGLLIIKYTVEKKILNVFYLVIFLHLLVTGPGMRLAGVLNANPEFSPPTAFDNNKELPVYFFQKIEPEIIWETGEISSIFPSYNFPANFPDKFYVMSESDKIDALRTHIHRNEFIVEEEVIYDRNFSTVAGNRTPRSRYKIHMILAGKE